MSWKQQGLFAEIIHTINSKCITCGMLRRKNTATVTTKLINSSGAIESTRTLVHS